MSKIQNIKNNKNKESIFNIIIILENDLKNIRKIIEISKMKFQKKIVIKIQQKKKLQEIVL